MTYDVITDEVQEKLTGTAKKKRMGVEGIVKQNTKVATSDGSTASYYELPANATELQDLISERDMNAQIGEIFRACYRYGLVSHSPKLRDIRKILFYAQAEEKRLLRLMGNSSEGSV